MIECTPEFWHAFYRAAGTTLGLLPLPALLAGFGYAMVRMVLRAGVEEEAERRRREEAAEARWRRPSA